MDHTKARSLRFQRIRAQMELSGVEVLLCSLGAEMPWLTGYEAMPLERPTVLVIPADAKPTLVVPTLEAPRVDHDEELFDLAPWRDGEDVIAIVATLVDGRASVGIGDRSWASLLLALQGALPSAQFSSATDVIAPIRAVKDAAEIDALRAAGAAADRVAAQLLRGDIALIGRTEAEVSADISRRLIDEGHVRVNFAIVGSGPNAASPHHEPGERRIGVGETVVCDFGGRFVLDGDVAYCSDITRTVVTGQPNSEIRELYDVLEGAQRAARAAVAPGVACEEIDAIGRRLITDAGYGELFVHRIGHGIGVEEHEEPYIVSGNDSPLVVGNAFSVEPGIYVSGRHGARIEDIVVVTEDGYLACNDVDHGLHVVEA